MDKEAVVCIHNGILLSYKKKHSWVSSKAHYTEWRKSEREKQITYTNTYVWNLKDGTDEIICRAAMETQK